MASKTQLTTGIVEVSEVYPSNQDPMPPEIKFFADESVERRLVLALRKKYVLFSADEIMKGPKDDLVLQQAEALKTILVTADKDFGELIYSGQQHHSGVVLYRLHGLPIEEKISIITAALDKYGPELEDSFTVITPQNIRLRKR